ncbi:hypothetical protein [Gemmatimonas sp.]|uniref:hypothetical protein n=1 Tax=Gemmatimonas sp. TaxID=1962908 RepID=UPI003F70D473
MRCRQTVPRWTWWTAVSLVALSTASRALPAQGARESHVLDLGSGAPLPGTLPFHVWFNLTGVAPKELQHIRLSTELADAGRGLGCSEIATRVARRDLRRALRSVQIQHDAKQRLIDVKEAEQQALANQPGSPRARALADELQRLRGERDDLQARAKMLTNDPLQPASTALPIASPIAASAEWTREPQDSTRTFALSVAPLAPNVRYVFCTETTRLLDKEELKALRAEIAGVMTERILTFVTREQSLDIEALARLQSALVGSLQRRAGRTYQFASPDAFLARLDRATEDDSTRTRRDSIMSAVLARAIAPGEERLAILKTLNRDPSPAVTALFAFDGKHQGTLAMLAGRAFQEPRTRDERERINDARVRFVRARQLAATLLNLGTGPVRENRRGQYERVANGAIPLERLAPSAANEDWVTVTTAEAVAARIANIDSTLSALRDLRELAIAVYTASPDSPFRAGVALRDVEDLHAAIGQASLELVAQRNEITRLGHELTRLRAQAADVASTIVVADKVELVVIGSTEADYVSTAQRYISADLGFVHAFRIGKDRLDRPRGVAPLVVPYIAANFYLRPVNKRARLASCDGFCWSRRLALTIGLTTNSIKRTGVRDDLFGSQSAVVAAGIRLTDYLRVTGGGLVFKSFESNGAERLSIAPAVSLSMDWDLRGTLGTAFGNLFPK